MCLLPTPSARSGKSPLSSREHRCARLDHALHARIRRGFHVPITNRPSAATAIAAPGVDHLGTRTSREAPLPDAARTSSDSATPRRRVIPMNNHTARRVGVMPPLLEVRGREVSI